MLDFQNSHPIKKKKIKESLKNFSLNKFGEKPCLRVRYDDNYTYAHINMSNAIDINYFTTFLQTVDVVLVFFKLLFYVKM